ncbi:TPA: hypothetical protein ACGEYS_004192, partial [Kluyvera cryocrescens]
MSEKCDLRHYNVSRQRRNRTLFSQPHARFIPTSVRDFANTISAPAHKMKWRFVMNMKIRKLFFNANKQQFNTYCFYG